MTPPRPTAAANRKSPSGLLRGHLPCEGRLDCRKMCVHPLAPSARGLRPQAVGERTVRLPEIFRVMARFSPSASAGNRSRRGRFFDTLRLFSLPSSAQKTSFLQNLPHRQHIPVHAEPYLILPEIQRVHPLRVVLVGGAGVVFQHTGQSGALVFRHFAQKRVGANHL